MSVQYQLTTSQWLALKPEVKAKLKEIFQIPRSAGTQMFQGPKGGEVISDGHTMQDLAAITLEKMSAYLGLKEVATNFYDCFDLVTDKIEGVKRENDVQVEKAVVAPPTEISAAIASLENTAPSNPDFDGYDTVHQIKKENGEPLLAGDLKDGQKVEVELIPEGAVVKPFCAHCTSKGPRHLKVCTRPQSS